MEHRQSRRDMHICIADAQSWGVQGYATADIFLKIDQNLCNLVHFLTHLSIFLSQQNPDFTHENKGVKHIFGYNN